jgi:hypothetical protein
VPETINRLGRERACASAFTIIAAIAADSRIARALSALRLRRLVSPLRRSVIATLGGTAALALLVLSQSDIGCFKKGGSVVRRDQAIISTASPSISACVAPSLDHGGSTAGL